MSAIVIETLGDQALLLRLGNHIDLEVNRRVHALAASIRRRSPCWLLDCVPAFATLALFVDPRAFPDSQDPLTQAQAWLAVHLAGEWQGEEPASDGVHDIPVCYEDELAPDLDDIAATLGMERNQVIGRHLGADYRVAMLGFAAGFPYLLGLDPTLTMPRLATPRLRVPAGSVAIGGAQTGIYPRESPGGWRIIGRTPLQLFHANRNPPAYLSPGDRVRLVRISKAEFECYESPA